MPFDKRKALQNALTFTQQGKWDKAITEYLAILKADPRDVTVYNNLGDLYARVGKSTEAIEHYLKLGELYRADGLSVKAIAVYKKIVKLDPNRIEAQLACADLYEEQGLTGEAKVQLATIAEQYAKSGNWTRGASAFWQNSLIPCCAPASERKPRWSMSGPRRPPTHPGGRSKASACCTRPVS
jgi:tetratricopeptide (TPR) repeat protein